MAGIALRLPDPATPAEVAAAVVTSLQAELNQIAADVAAAAAAASAGGSVAHVEIS